MKIIKWFISLFKTPNEIDSKSFTISEECRKVLIDNPEVLDYYLDMAIKMKDSIIDRITALTDRGYMFIEFIILISTILTAVLVNVNTPLYRVVYIVLMIIYIVIAVFSLFYLKSNKLLFKGSSPEASFDKKIWEWINNSYKGNKAGPKLYELESINQDISDLVRLNERIARRLKMVKYGLASLLLISLFVVLFHFLI